MSESQIAVSTKPMSGISDRVSPRRGAAFHRTLAAEPKRTFGRQSRRGEGPDEVLDPADEERSEPNRKNRHPPRASDPLLAANAATQRTTICRRGIRQFQQEADFVKRPVRKVQLLKRGRSSPFWYLRWWELSDDGHQWEERWRSTRTEVKKEAEALRRELERAIDEGKRDQTEMPWTDFVSQFLERHASRKPVTTLSAYRQCLNTFTKFMKPRSLTQVTHGVLEDFVSERLEQGAAKATVNRDLRHLRAALRWAKRRGLTTEAPDFHGIFVREDRAKPIVIPEEDFAAMIRALKKPDVQLTKRSADWWKVFLYLSYYLGTRRSETFGLTWGQVSLDTLEVRVLAPTSKGRKERVVPMAHELGQLLREWKDHNPQPRSSDEVLPWPFDNFNPMYEDWHAIQKAAGIPDGQHYVPKNCRSTCASALIASNVPTVVVKDFLGHATVATTENYYINTKPALRAAASARKVLIESESSFNESTK